MAREELAEARDKVADQREPVTARVHDVRTAIKKLRALRPWWSRRSGRAARRAGRRLQKVARGVSGARDAEVVLGIVRSGGRRGRTSAEVDSWRERAPRWRPDCGNRRVPSGPQGEPDCEGGSRASAAGSKRGYRPRMAGARSARARRRLSTRARGESSPRTVHRRRRRLPRVAPRREAHRHQVTRSSRDRRRGVAARVDRLRSSRCLAGGRADLAVSSQPIRVERSCFPWSERSCNDLLRLMAAQQRAPARARPPPRTGYSPSGPPSFELACGATPGPSADADSDRGPRNRGGAPPPRPEPPASTSTV